MAEKLLFQRTGAYAMRTRTEYATWGKQAIYLAILAVALYVIVSFPAAAGSPPREQEPVYNTATAIDFFATVTEAREVPAGNPLAGLHILVKAKGDILDVYVAPTAFAVKYGMVFAKGNDVHVIGSKVKFGETDVVLARQITTLKLNPKTGRYGEDTAFYMRNDEGPFWNSPTP
jgi:hypothetical protein